MSLCPVITGHDRDTGEPRTCSETIRDWTVCPVHANQLRQDLAELPAQAGDLDRHLARLHAGQGVGHSADTPMPYDQRASKALGDMRAVLPAWIRDLDENPEHHPADNIPAMARWLYARHHRLVAHPFAEEAVREIHELHEAALRAVDNPAERMFLGRCECGTDLHAPPDRRWSTCPTCGAVVDAETKRAEVLAALDDRLVTAAEFAHLAGYLGLIPQAGRDRARQRVNLWAARSLAIPHRRGPDPAYRYDDLAALLAANPPNPKKGHHMTTHPQCGKSWTGSKAEHCPVCCETFTGTKAGDRHRVGDHNDGTRRCLTAVEMLGAGLVQNDREFWQVDQKGREHPRARRTEPQSAEQPVQVLRDTPAESGPQISDADAVA